MGQFDKKCDFEVFETFPRVSRDMPLKTKCIVQIYDKFEAYFLRSMELVRNFCFVEIASAMFFKGCDNHRAKHSQC